MNVDSAFGGHMERGIIPSESSSTELEKAERCRLWSHTSVRTQNLFVEIFTTLLYLKNLLMRNLFSEEYERKGLRSKAKTVNAINGSFRLLDIASKDGIFPPSFGGRRSVWKSPTQNSGPKSYHHFSAFRGSIRAVNPRALRTFC